MHVARQQPGEDADIAGRLFFAHARQGLGAMDGEIRRQHLEHLVHQRGARVAPAFPALPPAALDLAITGPGILGPAALCRAALCRAALCRAALARVAIAGGVSLPHARPPGADRARNAQGPQRTQPAPPG